MGAILDSYGHAIPRSRSARSMGEAFDAAKQGGYKGFFWFPSLDPADQMPHCTRQTIAEKLNWLYNNVAAMRAVVDGLALDEVDTGLWPKPYTSSSAFNAAVKPVFAQQCGFHKAFSADGEDNFFSGQFRVRREIRLRGALFGAKLRAGEAAACAQLHFLPDWQCCNAVTNLDQALWRDGRMDNKFGRALKYRFVTSTDRKRWTDLDAADVIHYHDPFLTGQKRGMSELAPAVRKMFSLDDIERASTSGVLLRQRIAYAIQRAEGDESAPSLLAGARHVQTITNPDGSKVVIQKITVGDDTEVEVADLSQGKQLKVIESNKNNESSGWITELLEAVAQCTKYPAEYVFARVGLTQGTLVRMVQQKVQRVINTNRDFQLVMQYIDEWWPFWLWQNILAGRFDNVRGGIPDDWYSYLVVRPKDMTVDPGRDGRLYDERVRAGLMPWSVYCGMLYGEDGEEMEDSVIREAYRRRRRVAEIAAELNETPMSVGEIFKAPAGSAPPPESASSSKPGKPDEENEGGENENENEPIE